MTATSWIELTKRVSAPRYQPFWVLAISGLLGFRVGMVGFPTWQIAVETAQVVARLVQYPPDNPFYIYHTKLWNLVIQLCAVLLRAGVSEITLSKALSGLVGMVSFQALSLIVYAIGRDAILSIGAAVIVFVSRIADHGVIYPVMLLGTTHTYGALGLSFIVLAIALIGAGCYRTGAFLLGLAPAIHASIAVWLGLAVALALVWDFRRLREELRPALPYFVAGGAVTLASLLVQLIFIYDVPRTDPADVSRTYATFVRLWDYHRRYPADLGSTGVSFNRVGLALGLIWLIGFARDLARPAVFLLRVFVVTAAMSLAFVFLSWMPPDRLPMTLSILMPARLLNVNVMIVAPLLLGLMGVYRQKLSVQLLTLMLLCGLLLERGSMFWDWVAERQWQAWSLRFDPTVVLELSGLALVCVALSIWNGRAEAGTARAISAMSGNMRRITTVAARVSSFAVILFAAGLVWRVTAPTSPFRDRTNDPFFAAAASDHRGLIVTAGTFQLVQLYTRRPVLIDSGALDTISYAPESGPAIARILRDVYGIDFFNPAREVGSGSSVPHDVSKAYWARVSREQWLEISRTYNVAQVMTRADYVLDLPIAAETDGLRLYRIP